MITINHVTAENKIRGTVAGVPYTAPYTEENLTDLEAFKDSIEGMYPLQSEEDKQELGDLIKGFKEAVRHMNEEGFTPLQSQEYPEFVVDAKGNYYLQHNGIVSSLTIPKPIMLDIEESKEKELSYAPIIKFILRLFRNPSMRDTDRDKAQSFFDHVAGYVTQKFTSKPLVKHYMEEEGYSEEAAQKLSFVHQTPYTNEGLLSTKKVVSPVVSKYVIDEDGNPLVVPLYTATEIDENTGDILENNVPKFNEDWLFNPYCMGVRGDAFHCGSRGLGHTIAVGEETRLDSWDQVDCDPSHNCVKGLHFGKLIAA